MHLFSRLSLAFVRLSLLAVVAGLLPACSWYFGPGDEEGESTTDTDTDTTGDPDTTGGDTTGDPGPGDCLTVSAFLDRFGSCLSFDEWRNSNLCELAIAPTDGGGDCASCHSEGEDNVFISDDCAQTFRTQRDRPFVLSVIEPFSDRDGCYLGFRSGGGKLLAPRLGDEHPSFTLSERIRDGIVEVVNAAVGRALDESIDCSELD